LLSSFEVLPRERTLLLGCLEPFRCLGAPSFGLDARLAGVAHPPLAQRHGRNHDDPRKHDECDYDDRAHVWVLMFNRPWLAGEARAPSRCVYPGGPGVTAKGRVSRTEQPLMSIHIDQALEWRGRQVVDREGGKIGTFDEIYLDERTNEPAWAAVKTGMFSRRRRVVPISAAEADGSHVRVPFTKDEVKSAPTIDSEGWVSERDQAAILRHYGVSDADAAEPDASPQQHLRLKRHTVTETLTRRSEYGPD
jgi:hypothetical protein